MSISVVCLEASHCNTAAHQPELAFALLKEKLKSYLLKKYLLPQASAEQQNSSFSHLSTLMPWRLNT